MLHTVGFLALSLFLIALFLVLSQDIQIWPTALSSLFEAKLRDQATLPSGVRSSFLKTADGKNVEVWHLAQDEKITNSSKIVLIFHGNGGTVDDFFPYQLWLKELGLASYALEYRGYGKSSGWPSERGIYLDSEALWRHAILENKLDPKNVLLLGISFGAGPAAYLAQKYHAGALLLLSPYTSIPDIVRGKALLKYLAPFVWHEFPVKRYIEKLSSSNLIINHGVQDEVIPFSHSKELSMAYKGDGKFTFLEVPLAHHNDLFSLSKAKMAEELSKIGWIKLDVR